jgi:nucleoside-diphosphate-sugar epimerase
METQTDKRLVIFGCGYVGTAVAGGAVAAGWHVTALTRNAGTALLLREIGVHTVVADLAGSSWHDQIQGAPDYALNCVSSGGGGVEAYRHSYLAGMESILAWARNTGPVGTLVYTGSTSVYAQGDGARVDESMPALPATERGQLLLEAEARLRSDAGATRRWFVLRLAGIYGPGRHHLLEQVRAGEVSGLGDHHLNLIHRDDIVAAVMACFLAPATVTSQVVNLADDGHATKAEIVHWLAGQLGVAEPRFNGEPAGGRRMVTPDRVIVNDRAKTVLGWRPRFATFREGYGSLLSR